MQSGRKSDSVVFLSAQLKKYKNKHRKRKNDFLPLVFILTIPIVHICGLTGHESITTIMKE